MKIFTLLAVFTFSSLTPAMGQASETTAPKVDKRSTNQLASDAMNLYLKIFTSASTANSEATATTAATAIQENTNKLVDLIPLLKKAKKPTTTQMKQFALIVIKNNAQLREPIQKLTILKQSNNAQTNAILKKAMDNMALRTAPLTKAMNSLYPTKKMKTYIEEAKKKQSK